MKTTICIGLIIAAILLGLAVSQRRSGPPPDLTADILRAPNGVPKPRLPAPRIGASSEPFEAGAEMRSTNLFVRLMQGELLPKLTPQQVELYLDRNRRSAPSLLAAFRSTGEKALLEEAMAQYANDPRVAFAAVFRSDSSPEERRHWLDTFGQSASANPLANYLSSNEYFKSGQTDEAIKELSAAYKKPGSEDYSIDFVQNSEEAYQTAGLSETEAKVAANCLLELPQIAQLKELGRNIVDLANYYKQAGDETSFQATLQIGMNLGQRVSSGPNSLVQDLVGIAIETQVLQAMNPANPAGLGTRTVKERIDELAQRREAIRALTQQQENLLRWIAAEPDLANYFERTKMFGEFQAMRWLVGKYSR